MKGNSIPEINVACKALCCFGIQVFMVSTREQCFTHDTQQGEQEEFSNLTDLLLSETHLHGSCV